MFCYLFTFPNTFIHYRFSQKPPTASTLRSAFINDFLLRFPDQASPNQVYIRSITVFLLPRAVDIFIVNISFHVATINAPGRVRPRIYYWFCKNATQSSASATRRFGGGGRCAVSFTKGI